MAELSDVIRDYVNGNLEQKGGLFYFGYLEKPSSTQKEGETAILLQINSRINGYLIVNEKGGHHAVTYLGREETFIFNVSPEKMIIAVERPQVTGTEPVFPQAIRKEDWVSRPPFEISFQGDYSEHRKIMEQAAEAFKKDIKIGLWLPTFFKDP